MTSFPHLFERGRQLGGALRWASILHPETAMFDTPVSAMPDAEVHAAGDCTGLGLIRKATEDGARAACAI